MPMWNWRVAWSALGWCLVLGVGLVSLLPNPPQADVPAWDKLNHLFAYGLLMYWFAQLDGRRMHLAMQLLALGAGLEIVQGFTGYREASGLDMLANALGIAAGTLLAWRLPNPLKWLEAHRA